MELAERWNNFYPVPENVERTPMIPELPPASSIVADQLTSEYRITVQNILSKGSKFLQNANLYCNQRPLL